MSMPGCMGEQQTIGLRPAQFGHLHITRVAGILSFAYQRKKIMQKRIVLVLAILFIASISVFAQDATTDDLFGGVDGTALSKDQMIAVVGEGPQQAVTNAWAGFVGGGIGGAVGGAAAGGIGAIPGAIVGAVSGMAGGFFIGLFFFPDVDPEVASLEQQLIIQQAVIYSLCNDSGSSNDVNTNR